MVYTIIFSILISKRLNLVDIPSSRKIHKLRENLEKISYKILSNLI